LIGPLGIKTLDPSDWSYRGDYDNSNDSSDPSIAHGANYHQGPEWVFVAGLFWVSWLTFFADEPGVFKDVMQVVSPHQDHIATSAWAGLPELTNAEGRFCHDSCPTQAWSLSCMLEVMHQLDRIAK